jgi:hypothetical protein
MGDGGGHGPDDPNRTVLQDEFTASHSSGRERSRSTICIRFCQLRGQNPVDQRKLTTKGLREGCLQLALEIQKICCPGARSFDVSDWESSVFTNKEARTEDRILLRARARSSNEMEEDVLVGVLLAFMVDNSVPRVPGVDFRWCLLTQRIGLSSCALTGVTAGRH